MRAVLVIFATCLALAGGASAQPVTTIETAAAMRTVQGFEIPETVALTPAAEHLTLVGVATVERNYLPFYLAAVYRETRRGTPAAMVRGLEPVRFSIRWLAPTVDAKAMSTFWREVFAGASGDDAQLARMAGPIDRLVEAAGTATRGDRIDFDYNPESGLHVVRDGRVLVQLPGLEFNRLFLSIWLGDKADPAVRSALLGGSQASSSTQPSR